MADVSLLSQFLSRLRTASDSSGRLILSESVFPDGHAKALVGALPGQELILEAATVSADNSVRPTSIRVAGRCAGPWRLPGGPAVGITDIDVDVTFRLDPTTGRIADGIEIPVAGMSAQAAAATMKAAGFAADQIASGLNAAFGLRARGTASALRGAGFAADQVGDALKSAFGQSAPAAAQLLCDAGFGAIQVGQAVKNAFGLDVVGAAQILRGIGFGADEIGDSLRDGWNAPVESFASALRQAGFGVGDVGLAVQNAFDLPPEALKDILQGVGFAGDQVKRFLHSLGGPFDRAVAGLSSSFRKG